MNRELSSHVLNLNSTSRHIRSRSSTSSFDYAQSTTGSTYSASLLNSLLDVSPEPAYIAPAAATQIVTNNHGSFFSDQSVVSAGTPTIPVTAPALRILNQFLDYLLYSFLATAKSTSLLALKPAVTAVLKRKVSTDAISGADEELHSYLGGPEEAENEGSKQESAGEWDLERTWRRTRVRCMVYSSLGDLEEDDEAMYSQDDHLDCVIGTAYGVVSPAVAIWLTAILEYIGEQTLLIAGQATIVRYTALCAAATAAVESSLQSSVSERLRVEELDTEKVALNPHLGRIWRQWRKNIRGHGLSISISPSEAINQPWSSRPSTSKSYEWSSTTGANALLLPVTAESSGLELGITASQKGDDLEKSIPDLMEDRLLEDKLDEDIDTKNPLTPVWETGSNLDGRAESEVTEFEDDSTDIESWLAKYDDGRRPRSMIMFPWAVSSPQFDLPVDLMDNKRPRSLPPLDSPLAVIEAEVVEDPLISEDFLIDTSTDLSLDIHHPEDARSKIDKLMDRINMITSEQAELQKQLAAEEDFHSQAVAPAETIITGAPQRGGLTIVTSVADETDLESDAPPEMEEVFGFARASNYVKAVSPKEIQCITLVPGTGRSRRRVKGKSSKNSFTDSSETCSIKTTKGTLAPVSEISRSLEEDEKKVNQHPITDFREVIDTAMVSSDDENAITPVVKARSLKQITPSRLSPIPRPVSSHSKNPSSSSSTKQQNYTESRKNSYSSSIHNAPSTPSTLSDRSGRMRVRTSSGGADDLRPSSSMSRIVPRAIHTSSSMTSTHSHGIKSFMTWPGDSGRRAEDDTSSLRSEGLLNRSKTRDEKERSFEELIQSGGTIVCTLTPDEIRGMELPESSSVYKAGDLAHYIRNASPDGMETPRPASKAKSIPAKVPASLARDARVDDTSCSRDLALFLRSTGPPQGSVSTPTGTKASKLIGSGSSSNSSPTTTLKPGSPTIKVPSVMTLQRMDTLPSTPQPGNKKKYVAREASGSTGDSTSALADFFRNTLPPIDGENVPQRRISRSVAPFRTTMDSAQFDMASEVLRKPLNDAIIESMSVATDSYQSSTTSSTGLLSSPVREDAISAMPRFQRPALGSDGPVRTRRRVKDPYAIDDDDDLDPDDDMDLVIPAPAKHQESLADFLRNAPPPPPPASYTRSEEPITTKKVPKKSSAVNLMTRFSRGPNRKNSISSPVSLDKSPPHRMPVRSDTFDSTWSSDFTSPKTDSGNRPRHHTAGSTNQSMDLDTIHNTLGMGGLRSHQSRPKPVGEARGARVVPSSGVDDLATFLRDSAPPTMGPAPERRIETREREKEESGRSKFKSMTFRSKGKRKELSGMV